MPSELREIFHQLKLDASQVESLLETPELARCLADIQDAMMSRQLVRLPTG